MLKLTKWAIISALCVTANLHAVEFITQSPKGFMDFKLKDGLRVQTHYHIQQKHMQDVRRVMVRTGFMIQRLKVSTICITYSKMGVFKQEEH
ncbi:hypothetical protein [Zooshikella harenae]|uniref:Uncharacterized protein n=1 Tax=Zooshikella harenae TaxID=2827238 RepID=A0ABS5ZEV8_9GAMM|nr:hypothetical protein [Zooshikella harenae]MBU2712510.1 hypothetical protein [Zooshikella harenae]